MDLAVPYSHNEERMAEKLADLKRFQWGACAVEVKVLGDNGAAVVAEEDEDELETEENRFQGQGVLSFPSLEDMNKVFGSFPTVMLSERSRERGSDDLDLYSKVTFAVSSAIGITQVLRDPRSKLFDLVALEPVNSSAFSHISALVNGEQRLLPFDILKINLRNEELVRMCRSKLPLFRKKKLFIELNYTQANHLHDDSRRSILANAKNLLQGASHGHLHSKGAYTNFILSGGDTISFKRQCPEEVFDLGVFLGLRKRDAQAAVTTACQAVLKQAEKRRRTTGFS